MSSSVLSGHHACTWHKDTHAGKNHINKINKSNKEFKDKIHHKNSYMAPCCIMHGALGQEQLLTSSYDNPI